MYGYDDDQLDSIIREKLAKVHIFVQMSLDESQDGIRPGSLPSHPGLNSFAIDGSAGIDSRSSTRLGEV